jgi:hypothetical protein
MLKNSIFTFLILLIAAFCTCEAQNLGELEKRNGFKDIKLGMIADSVKGVKLKKEFKERDEFPAKLFEVENPEYARIGEVNVNKVELKSYKDQIYQIHVVTDKDRRLMKALESIYGRPEYDLKGETYFWKSENLILTFRSFSKDQLEMIYTSYVVLQKMKDDKGKKVQDIADDF